MKLQTVLLFGAPGCGKGTQGKALGTLPGYFHCSCGEVFRSLRLDSPLGRVFVQYSSQGQLVPDEPTVQLWREFIENTERAGRYDPRQDRLLLDGIPRHVRQAELLADTLDVRAVVHLHCPDPARLIERLQRRALRENRLDDAQVHVIRDRLATYEQETRPVLDFYGPAVRHTVDALQKPEAVLRDLLGIVMKL
ncbi:adenylate kinase [Gammaproteobacteria bacterium]|nr:adenylate kinase [Gammaproteobacteria bacterium]